MDCYDTKPTLDVEVEQKHVEDAVNAFQTEPWLEKRVVAKLDMLLMPLLSIFFIFLFLDRANIGNARVAGFQKAIHVTDSQYQIGWFSFVSSLNLD